MATESQPIDIDDESDVADLRQASRRRRHRRGPDGGVAGVAEAAVRDRRRRRAVARQLEQEEQPPPRPPRRPSATADRAQARGRGEAQGRGEETRRRHQAQERRRARREENARASTPRSPADADGPRRDRHRVHARLEEVAVGLELKNACANFDLAVKFFEKHAAMLAARPARGSGRNKGTRATPLRLCTTARRGRILGDVEGNLKVPDGRAVKRHGRRVFGRGIYTTTDPRLAFAYAKDAIVFACLALPGASTKTRRATGGELV